MGRAREASSNRRRSGVGESDDELEDKYKSWTRGHVLGTGAFGIVFRAQLTSTLEFVAVKEVSRTTDKMEKEIRVMMRLQHPHIVAVYGHLRVPDTTTRHIVMQYCPDGTLRSFVKNWCDYKGTTSFAGTVSIFT